VVSGRRGPDRSGRRLVRTYLVGAVPGGVIFTAMLVGTAFAEWHVATGDFPSGTVGGHVVALAIGLPILASLPPMLAGSVVILVAYRHTTVPLLALRDTAARIAAEGWAAVPSLGREDEFGDLARALQRWQEASAMREILLSRAPVGVCRLDEAGRFRDVNPAAETMLGCPRDGIIGHDILEFVHPADVVRGVGYRHAARSEGLDRSTFEGRLSRADGSQWWCSAIVAPIGGEDGLDDRILILDDITERKRQAEHASSIQRQLLPGAAPPLPGYHLAGACRPAQNVGGDLYDWSLPDDGHLDITVADVMGKGMGAALVMARLQVALRTAPELDPVARVAGADRSVTFELDGTSLFVTLFHARLELATGLVRYVDAGHGHWMVVRADGRSVHQPGTSLPLGLDMGEVFRDATLHLEPGDTLLVYSDGLVEREDGLIDAASLAAMVAGAGGVDGVVERLVDTVPDPRPDDVTALALTRLPAHRGRAPARTRSGQLLVREPRWSAADHDGIAAPGSVRVHQ
jgi:PAS domain S-box-containing protein